MKQSILIILLCVFFPINCMISDVRDCIKKFPSPFLFYQNFKNNELRRAIRNGDVKNFKYYLKQGADPLAKDYKNTTVFMLAAGNKNPVFIEILELYSPVGLVMTDVYGRNAWMLAASTGSLPVIKICCKYAAEYGVSLQKKTPHGWNALMYAVYAGRYNVVHYFLRNHFPSEKELDPRINMLAVQSNNPYLLTLLKQYKILNIENKEEIKDLVFQAVRKSKSKSLFWFLQQGCDLTEKNREGNTVLMECINLGFFHLLGYVFLYGNNKTLFEQKNDKNMTTSELVELYERCGDYNLKSILDEIDELTESTAHVIIQRLSNQIIRKIPPASSTISIKKTRNIFSMVRNREVGIKL